ncbi:MAG TPA: HIT family protein [Thermoanaerobaculia bacterium]|jgi:histidine triad (HIT) family protein|nr:HIT family protein [Thermoanaerobaculia bacterium]
MARPRGAAKECVFCGIVRGTVEAAKVFEDDVAVAFLDHRPLLAGHCLFVPKLHVETLPDLPEDLLAPFFRDVQLLTRAVERGMEAEGSFVAVNNKISQSVPHLHVHVVPRWKGDGLFSAKLLWKRAPYRDEAARREVQGKIRRAVGEVQKVM